MTPAPIRRRTAPAPVAQAARGYATVSSTVERSAGKGAPREVLHDDSETIPLRNSGVIPAHRLARIEVSAGMTVNLGNFESARIDVRVSLPCDIDALPEAYEDASAQVAEFYNTEQARWVAQ